MSRSIPAGKPIHQLVAALLVLGLSLLPAEVAGGEASSPTKPLLRKLPQLHPTLRGRSEGGESTQQEQQPSGPQGGSGVYVLDNVDFHPVGGGAIPNLGWNNKIPVTSYYQYQNHSFIIITGTVHGDGLISGPGQDDWTFMVKLNTDEIISPRPAGCRFSIGNRPQTDAGSSAWKYQILIVFNDTASKPECFEYFQSLANRPLPVKLIDIVGPYWTGNKQYQEPKNRYFKTGPMLATHDNLAGGHTAEPW